MMLSSVPVEQSRIIARKYAAIVAVKYYRRRRGPLKQLKSGPGHQKNDPAAMSAPPEIYGVIGV